ncbi:chemotaxis protein, partial [Motilibacter sp. K478]|nr:chemotaxis protein [Motilibacter aurantiacus]
MFERRRPAAAITSATASDDVAALGAVIDALDAVSAPGEAERAVLDAVRSAFGWEYG